MADEPKVDSPSAGPIAGPPSGVYPYQWEQMRKHLPPFIIELSFLMCFNERELRSFGEKCWEPLPPDDVLSFMKAFCKRYESEHGADALARVLEVAKTPAELRFVTQPKPADEDSFFIAYTDDDFLTIERIAGPVICDMCRHLAPQLTDEQRKEFIHPLLKASAPLDQSEQSKLIIKINRTCRLRLKTKKGGLNGEDAIEFVFVGESGDVRPGFLTRMPNTSMRGADDNWQDDEFGQDWRGLLTIFDDMDASRTAVRLRKVIKPPEAAFDDPPDAAHEEFKKARDHMDGAFAPSGSILSEVDEPPKVADGEGTGMATGRKPTPKDDAGDQEEDWDLAASVEVTDNPSPPPVQPQAPGAPVNMGADASDTVRVERPSAKIKRRAEAITVDADVAAEVAKEDADKARSAAADKVAKQRAKTGRLDHVAQVVPMDDPVDEIPAPPPPPVRKTGSFEIRRGPAPVSNEPPPEPPAAKLPKAGTKRFNPTPAPKADEPQKDTEPKVPRKGYGLQMVGPGEVGVNAEELERLRRNQKPKRSIIRRLLSLLFWTVIVVGFILGGAYTAFDQVRGQAKERIQTFRNQPSLAAVTSLLAAGNATPAPVVSRSVVYVDRAVPGPTRDVVRTVEVPGPERVVTREVPGPVREVVRTVEVPGPERVVVREVPAPERSAADYRQHFIRDMADVQIGVGGPIEVRMEDGKAVIYLRLSRTDGEANSDIRIRSGAAPVTSETPR